MPSGKTPGGYSRPQTVWPIWFAGPSDRAQKPQNDPALPIVHENKHTINPADFPLFQQPS
jgi:hypothetical protein